MAKQMMRCLKCGVELSMREMLSKHCFICDQPPPMPKGDELDQEWATWNDAIYRNDK